MEWIKFRFRVLGKGNVESSDEVIIRVLLIAGVWFEIFSGFENLNKLREIIQVGA